MGKRLELEITSGEMSGKRFEVPQTGLRLGRSSLNDIHAPDEALSRNHCLFEQEGETGITLIDLGSSNGTAVNGELIGADVRSLKAGDVIEVGSFRIEVKGEESAAAPAKPAAPEKTATPGKTATSGKAAAPGIDLGLGKAVSKAAFAKLSEPGPKARRSSRLLLAVVAAFAIAICAVLFMPSDRVRPRGDASGGGDRRDATRPVTSLCYEKVEADATRIFRYVLTLEAGRLRVAFDDVPGESRHVDKSAALTDAARSRIEEIFATDGWEGLSESYGGASASDLNALKSWRIRVVREGSVKETLVENETEPEPFRTVREALETFSRNELGVWAIQYSREKLLELSAADVETGDAKWAERDVEFGNVAEAVGAYREAVFYLDTVRPKPDGYAELREKLRTAEEELDRRYREQRFVADKAINLQEWEEAREQLRILCDIVPAKDDPRHAEANGKLVDVENRIRKAKKGGK